MHLATDDTLVPLPMDVALAPTGLGLAVAATPRGSIRTDGTAATTTETPDADDRHRDSVACRPYAALASAREQVAERDHPGGGR